MTIGIIDYGMGNIKSVQNSLEKIGYLTELIHNRENVIKYDWLILPGVGAFPEAMNKIKSMQFDEAILEHVNKNKPIIGICLGMQLLFTSSEEFGYTEGLNLIPGRVLPFSKFVKVKVPHMGWNDVITTNNRFSELEGDYYFVHSYFCKPDNEEDILFKTDYQISYCSGAMKKDLIYGLQFHPEKSQSLGLKLLKKIISEC